MKKNIVMIAYGSKKWIGGIYYKKNIIYSLLQNERILNKYNVVLCTTKELVNEFSCFKSSINIKVLPENKRLFYALIAIMMFAPQNKYFYSFTSIESRILLNRKCVYWIPDFQYIHYPEYFGEKEVIYRNENYLKIAHSHGKLILSSEDCKKDYLNVFSDNCASVFVVPFVSYIESEIKCITETLEAEILKKYNLTGNQYVYIPNQFWKHKNHIVVLQAIEYIKNQNIKFVFTGELEDYRNPDYILQLKEIFKKLEEDNVAINLGFIERIDQIIIMKNARFIIQPSLFEGWGTVLEDAKVLDKKVLLSNIGIHREQKYEKCVLFNPHDAGALAQVIEDEWEKTSNDKISLGLQRMKENAIKYSLVLEKVFE